MMNNTNHEKQAPQRIKQENCDTDEVEICIEDIGLEESSDSSDDELNNKSSKDITTNSDIISNVEIDNLHSEIHIKEGPSRKPLEEDLNVIRKRKRIQYHEHECRICSKSCSNETTLKSHILRKHPKQSRNLLSKEDIFSCRYCKFKTHYEKTLENHEKSHFREKLKCLLCHRLFVNPETFKRHITDNNCSVVSCKKIYYCDFCNYRSLRQVFVHKHMRTHKKQEENILYCNNCKFECADKDLLITHMEEHRKDQERSCHFCSNMFPNQRLLIKHISQKHGEKTGNVYKCKECRFEASKINQYQRHMVTHLKKLTFPCDYCEKNFPIRGNLNTHLFRSHYEEFKKISKDNNIRIYSCKDCNFETLHSNKLKMHLIDNH